MNILDLPQEIVNIILYYSILSRTIRRALRLKLVCNEFNYSFHSAWWNNGKNHDGVVLWHDYLVFRCRDQRDESVPCYVEMRSLANTLLLCSRTQGDCHLEFDEILDRFCWLVQHQGGRFGFAGWNSHERQKRGSINPGRNLLSAATYFGCVSLVRHLLSQGHDPTHGDDLFPSPMYLAAWTGRADMLQIMQEHLPELEVFRPDCMVNGWRAKIGPTSLVGAASRGDIDMVRLSLYPPSRIIPQLTENNNTEKETSSKETLANSMLVWGEKPGSVAANSRLGWYITHGMYGARSPDVYEYLQSFLKLSDEELQKRKNGDLARMAEYGDIVMVRHLLAMGADPSNKKTPGGTALAHAVRACHEDVVDLLLEHGADPSEPGMYRAGTPLTAAAKAGSMAMVRKLLDAGAQATRHDMNTLRSAIKAEHTAMVDLLLDMGFATENKKGRTLRMADNMGLESMAGFLRSKGITLEGIPKASRLELWHESPARV